MEEITANVSWIGVIVGTVLAMGLGFVWFNPKFKTGKIWAEGVGVGTTPPDEFPMHAMVANTIGLFGMSWFVGVTAANDALLTVILATLAFAFLNGANALFAGASKGAVRVTFGYWVLSLILMIISQAIF